MSSLASISTGALMASNYANKSQKELNNSIARISSGKRAMRGQDPAGQGIADSLNSSSRSWNVAARNAEDGISAAQIAESSLMEIAALAQRLREIAIQADNADIQSTSDKTALDAEAAAIYDAVDAIIEDQRLRAFCFFFICIKQLLLHEVIPVEPLRATNGVVSVDSNL